MARKIKANYRRSVLRLPDLDHSKTAVLNTLSQASRRVYQYAMNQFIAWYCSEPRLAFNRIVVIRYRTHLQERGLAANTINQQLAAVRRLAHEAADAGLLSPELAAGHQSGERSEATWPSRRELAEPRPEFGSAELRTRHQPTSEAELCDVGTSLRMWIAQVGIDQFGS